MALVLAGVFVFQNRLLPNFLIAKDAGFGKEFVQSLLEGWFVGHQ